MSRRVYHREWAKKHPGYKTADSRLRALFQPARRAFFREILGIRVRVNLLAGLLGILLALMFCGTAHAQEPRTYTVPFHTVNGMILLDAKVNGKPAVMLLDTGARNSIVDYRAAGFDDKKPLLSLGGTGSGGTCMARRVDLSLERRSWPYRLVCVMDLADASKRAGTHLDGFIGVDVLGEFRAVRIDYKAQTVTLED